MSFSLMSSRAKRSEVEGPLIVPSLLATKFIQESKEILPISANDRPTLIFALDAGPDDKKTKLEVLRLRSG
jgi:hypothetical protein